MIWFFNNAKERSLKLYLYPARFSERLIGCNPSTEDGRTLLESRLSEMDKLFIVCYREILNKELACFPLDYSDLFTDSTLVKVINYIGQSDFDMMEAARKELTSDVINESVDSICQYTSKVSLYGRTIFVYIGDNFIDKFNDISFKTNFLRQLLTAMYSIDTITNVNNTSVYSKYIEALLSHYGRTSL